MDTFFYYFVPVIVLLGILIFFHELGHFIIAKLFGVRVLKFSLGFGPKLVGKKIGETEYLISSLPLGGYVKMLGEGEDEQDDSLSPEEELRAFNKQHVLKRIAIVSAGPLFNFFLAFLVYFFSFMVQGTYVSIPEIGNIVENSPAQKAGLKIGDKIISVDRTNIENWMQFYTIVQESENKTINITVKRGDRRVEVSLVPLGTIRKNLFGEDTELVRIGIEAKSVNVSLSPIGAFKEGVEQTWFFVKLTCLTIVKLIQGVVPLKTLGGPIMIGQLTGKLAQESLSYLFPLLAIISINLGVINLLPVPILDGGFIIFLFIELILGKPLSMQKREMAQKVGLVILVMLMILVFYNDVNRFFE